MIKIGVTLTKADIMISRLMVFFRSGLGVAIVIMALGLAGGNYAFGIADTDSSFNSVWFPVTLGCLIIPGAVAAAGINGAAVRKMLALVYYRFDAQGIHIEAPHVSGRFEWQEVRRAYESKRLFVFTTPGSLQIIPKRFASADSLAVLKNLARANLKGRAKFNRE